MADEVKFSKGLSTNIPSDRVPGRILIETDTGKMHLDVDDSNRIDLGSPESPSKLPETTLTVDLSSDTSEKFNGTKDVNLGVKNILPTKHGGLNVDSGYIQTGKSEQIQSNLQYNTIEGQNNSILYGQHSHLYGQYNIVSSDNVTCYGQNNTLGFKYLPTGIGIYQISISDNEFHTNMIVAIGQDSVDAAGKYLKPGSIWLGLSENPQTKNLETAIIKFIDVTPPDGDSYEGGTPGFGNGIILRGQIYEAESMTVLMSPSPAELTDCAGCIIGGYDNTINGDCKCSYTHGAYTQCLSGSVNHISGQNQLIRECTGCFVTGRHNGSYNSYAQFLAGRYINGESGPASESDMSGTIFIVGNGKIGGAFGSNAFRIETSGKVYGNGAYNTSGADYAEMFEWADGNPNDEDRRGLLVTLEGEKIRVAEPEDTYILGVVSATPAIVGDSYFGDNWHNMYKRDVFGQIITKSVDIPEHINDQGIKIPEHKELTYELNPEYDPNKEYVPRTMRKEWAPVGLLGKLIVKDDGTCKVNEFCTSGPNGIATYNNSGYRVISRIDDSHVKILIDG